MNAQNVMSKWDYMNERVLFWMDLNGDVGKKGVNTHDVCRSIRKNSWFSNSKLSMYDSLRVTKMWFGRCMNDYVVNELKLNKNTVIDLFMFCREVCMNAVVNESVKIGGVNVIVEIDESKFGKMKYVKRQACEWKVGVWRYRKRNENRCFFRVVERRTKEELLCVIKEWVLPGSTIISDCWKS
ncbi:mitotic-spindle organizing protein 2A [Trichonephila clavipes]|nr:mitotic-spindle organizing protein 2A [Trichonephila clavipes]